MARAPGNDDLTTCVICQDTFDNPKALPCLHAFCLKCLDDAFGRKLTGDIASCPECRRDFRIPRGGVGGLPHYFIVQQLVDNEKERERLRKQGNYCDKHKDKEIELYCYNCNENICVKCSYAVEHRNHKTSEMAAVVDEFKLRIDDDNKKIMSAISSVREQSEQTKCNEREFLITAEDVKRHVLAVSHIIERSVDSQINDVLMELQSVTSESAKQAESVQEAYQLALVSMESFHAYSRELLDKGRPSDITRAACELHDRATELLKNDVTAVKYRPPHVTFTPADVMQVKRLNLIGKLTVETEEQRGMSLI